jgi:hypothetical protein
LSNSALETPSYSVLDGSNACLLDPKRVIPEDDLTIHHGDNNEEILSCRLVNLGSDATIIGEEIPKAWPTSETIASQYLIKACKSKEGDNTSSFDAEDSRIKRVMLADDDTRRLHHARMQMECSAIDFQKVLNDSNVEGRSTEKIVSQLRCKAIVNIGSLSGVKPDIVGDCSVILTENIDPSSRYRRIYFVQEIVQILISQRHGVSEFVGLTVDFFSRLE